MAGASLALETSAFAPCLPQAAPAEAEAGMPRRVLVAVVVSLVAHGAVAAWPGFPLLPAQEVAPPGPALVVSLGVASPVAVAEPPPQENSVAEAEPLPEPPQPIPEPVVEPPPLPQSSLVPTPEPPPVEVVQPQPQPQTKPMPPAPPPQPQLQHEAQREAPAEPVGMAEAEVVAEAPAAAPVSSEVAIRPPEVPVVRTPQFLSSPAPPRYPRQAVRMGLEGTVIVRALLGGAGEPQDVQVWHSSGFDVLDLAALEAVSGWRFQPYTVAGTPTLAWVEVPVRFRLN